MMRHLAPTRPRPTARLLALALLLPLLGLTPPRPAAAGSILPALDTARRLADPKPWDIGKHYVRVGDNVWVAVKGRRERRQVRYSRLWSVWSADQRRTAVELGFPVNRLLEIGAGRETETWSYPERRLRIVFDDEGRLLARQTG